MGLSRLHGDGNRPVARVVLIRSLLEAQHVHLLRYRGCDRLLRRRADDSIVQALPAEQTLLALGVVRARLAE